MTSKPARLTALGLFLLGLASSSGCLFVTDLINPGVLTQFGIDPNSVLGSAGNIIIVFDNQTQSPVEFHFYRTDDPTDLSVGTRTVTKAVDPQDDTNEVFQCPTGAISLGIVGANFAVTNTGATVFAVGGAAGAAGTAVPYTGAVLREGVDYSCGDVIQYTISPGTTGAGAAGFVITATRIPGR